MKKNELLRRIVSLLLIFTLISSLFVNLPLFVDAEEEGVSGGQSNIVNGGFETPDNYRISDLQLSSPSCYKYVPQGEVSGWNTTSTNGRIEIGWMNENAPALTASPHMKPDITKAGYTADGAQLSEVIADEVSSSLYQELTLNAGETYNWSVNHRGRVNVDTLALIITDYDSSKSYVKASSTDKDIFNQILDWMETDKNITAPSAGEMAEYTVYTTELAGSTSFESSENGSFSFSNDAEHTLKFEIHLMSTDKTTWGNYSGSYISDKDKKILFVLTSFKSSFNKPNGGNLIDKIGFTDENGNNLLINPSFDDVTINSAYASLPTANATNPTAGIGWYTTAHAAVIEIGNFENGNAYGITVAENVLNKPYIREGEQFAELNADQESSLYQIVETDPGKMYKWSLSHRGRSGLDTMALIIGPAQFDEERNSILPKKTNTTARDQLMQIVDWLYSQTEMAIDIPKQGCSEKIKLYTPKFNKNGGWELSENIFSWHKNSTHTEEWSVWIIASTNDKWHDYGEIDENATYDYNYIVPKEQNKSIFGFVSHNSTLTDGKKNITYGNLLDNIAFKEYYYVKVEVAMSDSHGHAQIIVNENNEFIHDEKVDESLKSGWALIGSNFTVHVKEAEGEYKRGFIGAYINGTFVKYDKWTKNEVTGEYTYTFDNVQSAIKVQIIFAAHQIYYDSRSNYPYQYDPENSESGPEVPMKPVPGQDLPTYTSHKPYEEDGWKFMGWKYISNTDNHVYLFDAVHKVALEGAFVDDTPELYFSVYDKDATQATVSSIPYNEGITFLAEWEFRQRAVAKTFDKATNQYVASTDGGTVDINVSYGDEGVKTNYPESGEAVGKELYASADETYVTVSAYQKTGYTFNGWYEDGNLVSRNTSYTYKVPDGDTVELYAYFEPYGFDLFIKCDVIGDTDDLTKYFQANCTFSNLRENQLYIISGLAADTEHIIINGERVYNPITIKADENGKATATIYMKNGDSGRFVFLPENCTYTIQADAASSEGFSVRGEVETAKTLTETATENLLFYKASQSALLEVGKKYEGVAENKDIINITKNSSYTFQATTKYTPQIYTDLNASLCFYNSDGIAKNFISKTRILMIDLTYGDNPKFYSYIVNDSVSEIALTEFTALGTTDKKFALPQGSMVTEKLVFTVDYVDTGNEAESGKISLVYDDSNNELVRIINPPKKTVNIGADTTDITAEAGNSGKAASVGPFAIDIGIAESSPAINTTYKEDGNSKYAVKLSVEGDMLPDGTYAEIGGNNYFISNGYITIPSLDAGNYSVNVYSPVPISNSSVTFKTSLLEEISASPAVPAEITKTVTFNCENVAMDADVVDKVLNPGNVSNLNVTLKYEGIDGVKLTVTKKGSGETLISDLNITLPTQSNNVMLTSENGFTFTAVSGETYIFSFVGLVNGVPVLEDKCCVVGGYVTQNN